MAEFMEYTDPMWRGLDMRKLKVDEAYLVPITAQNAKTAHLYFKSDECYSCPFSKLLRLHPDASPIAVKVSHQLRFLLLENDVGRYAFDNETALCRIVEDAPHLQEFGVYNFTFNDNDTASCNIIVDKNGVNVNLSILAVLSLVALLLAFGRLTYCVWKRYRYNLADNVDVPEVTEIPIKTKRMRSLDGFRGIAIVLMIFVNSGGGGYWWIEHATWNGLHLADVVFPSFLWIMGVCIPISIRSQLCRGTSKLHICQRIIWVRFRGFAVLIFGRLFLNSINGPQLENIRIMGVLQRFGIAYLICGLLHTLFSKKDIVLPQTTWKRNFRDLILFRREFAASFVLIAIYLGFVFGFNTPNCPRGYLGPGGKHAYAQYPNCTGGAIGYIDLKILGNNHIYQWPTSKKVYDSMAFDPEGLFGCLLTVVQVMAGILAGVQILTFTEWQGRIKRWMSWSVITALIGAILCGFSKETGPIPLNKNLWSLSFVCLTTSLAYIFLSFLFYVIDVRKWYNGYPFVESGMNAIFMYVGHTVMHKMLPWHWRIGAMNTHFVLLLESLWNTGLWIAIALYLDAKEFYYSI